MRSAGVSIEVLRKYVSLVEQGDATLEERKALLEKQRVILENHIEKLQDSLAYLNVKIDHHDEKLNTSECISKKQR